MARPLKHKELTTLQQPGDVAIFRSHDKALRRKVRDYAARHKFTATVERLDEPAGVQAEQGVLWRVERT